jgi:hypothetical protein
MAANKNTAISARCACCRPRVPSNSWAADFHETGSRCWLQFSLRAQLHLTAQKQRRLTKKRQVAREGKRKRNRYVSRCRSPRLQ